MNNRSFNIRPFLRGVAVVFAIGAAIFIFLLINQWQGLTVGAYTVRRNRLTDIVQIQVNGQWTRFQDDPYATPLPPETLEQVKLEDLAWGPDGILCGRLRNRLSTPLKGRLAIQIIFRNKKDNHFVRDRALRATVDLPPDHPVPFVLDTNLSTPDLAKTKVSINLVPTAASGL